MVKKEYLRNICFCLIFAFLAGCGEKDPFEGFDPYAYFEQNIYDYHRISQKFSIDKKAGNPKVYIDFSDGLIQAYTNNTSNQVIIQSITNKLVSTNVEWYSLGNSKIELLSYSSNELFNKVTNPTSYKDMMAPIQKALDSITNSKNDAILITDFEEYTADGVEQFENYPKKYFIDWIKAGNLITFFYTEFTEVNRRNNLSANKKLYFTVFTYGVPDKSSLLFRVKEALEGKNLTKIFEIGGKPVVLKTKYENATETGLTSSTFQKWVSYNYSGLEKESEGIEVIGINKKWDKNLLEYFENEQVVKGRVFLSKLFLDASDKTYYNLRNIKLQVSNITEDFVRFAKYKYILATKPNFTLDDGKNRIWDPKTKTNAVIMESYEPNTEEIKQKYRYSSELQSLPEIVELFEFESKIFEDHLRNDPANVELRTLTHRNYNKKSSLQLNEDLFVKINLIYDDISFNYNNPQLKDFEWQSITKSGRTNNSLSEAIRNTLQDPDINPNGKPMYTYYIKFSLQKNK